MTRLTRRLLLVALVAMVGACERSAAAPIPDGIDVGVEIDGAAAATIDSAALRARPADFRDGGHQAWKLTTLLGEKYQPTMAVALEDDAGDRHMLTTGSPEGDRLVVVAVSKDGELRVGVVSAATPFPPFHGRGGSRGRQGDPSRVKHVKRVLVGSLAGSLVGSADAPATSASAAAPDWSLEVRVAGGATLRWGRADLDRVASVAFTPSDGEKGARRGWPVRELLRTLVGSDAVLFAVEGKRGRSVAVDDTVWQDAGNVPLLRVNRDGELKLFWVKPDGSPLGLPEVRRLTAFEVRRAGAN